MTSAPKLDSILFIYWSPSLRFEPRAEGWTVQMDPLDSGGGIFGMFFIWASVTRWLWLFLSILGHLYQ